VQVIQKSGLYRTLGHQLFNGYRKPSRDKVIQIAFGFESDYAEAQEMLKKARMSPLYPRIKRDSVIIHALTHKRSFLETQSLLYEMGLPILGERQ
jgi:hypothetical protein